MRAFLFIISVFLLRDSFCQTRWFKHLPGYEARTSLLKDDSILTTGMEVVQMQSGYNKYNVSLTWNKLSGDSIDYFKIELDSLENDSIRSTFISSDYSASIIRNEGSEQFLGLRYGAKKDRSFILSLNKFYSREIKLNEVTLDTFSTYLDKVLPKSSGDIKFLYYVVVNKPFTYIANPVIYKGTRRIMEYNNLLPEKYKFYNQIESNKSELHFFFILEKMWNFHSSPEAWEDYAVKMDTSGKEVWRCQVNNRDSINPTGMQIIQKKGGNLLVSWTDERYRPYRNPYGSSLSQANHGNTIWFAEVDSTGKVLWRKNLKNYLSYKLGRDTSHNLVHAKAIPLDDGVIWIGTASYIYWHNYALKTDYNGNPIWYREYDLYPSNSLPGGFKPKDVALTKDKGFIITGEFESWPSNLFPNGCRKATLIKVDSFGCLVEGCQLKDSIPKDPTVEINSVGKLKSSIFPNPAKESIQINVSFSGNFQIRIFNKLGLLLFESLLSNGNVLQIGNLSSDVYLLEVYFPTNGICEYHKLIIN